MKKLTLLFIGIFTFQSLSAQQVTQDAALKKAEQFLGKASLSSRALRKAPQLTLANSRDEFYAFNDKANGGYVIVSGEERMPDVLAYSYDSRFDADNIPCNMKAWLEGYAEQVKYLRTHPEASAKRTTTERKNVDPLLTCWFHQGSPYSDKCPKYCLTGCVATAMAQIMYYWQWPKQTTDVIPGYTTYTQSIEMPEIPVTTIDWDNMLGEYKYGESYTEEQTDAISTLLLLCGTSVKMNYTNTQSAASSFDAAKAFRIYFDYDDMLEYVSRSAYSTEDWEQLIYDELKSKHPVYYDGYGNDVGGHAFVLDGYVNGYFHVNWGWGGDEAYVLMPDPGRWEGFFYEQHAIVGLQPVSADNPSRYAVLDNGKMTLYYDKKKSSRSGTVLSRKDDWQNYLEEITECVIDKSFANLKQRNLSGYFEGMQNLKSIKGIKYLNTSEVTDMGYMFDGCSGLTSLDVSGFKTDKVTYMGAMFRGCSGLTSLDVSGFKTDNVMGMWAMFYECSGLTSLDVSGFKTDNVMGMGSMFSGCSGLTKLDVSGFKTDKVVDMGAMFWGCSSLTKLDVSGFKTDNVIYMNGMFSGCSGLTKLDVSGFKTDNVELMCDMFYCCSGLTSLDVSGFKTDKVTNMWWMFGGCSGLTSLDVSGFNTDKVTSMEYMFQDCSGLTSLDVSSFNTDNVTDMPGMFRYCSELTTIYASECWNMDNVENTEDMFDGCSKIVGGEGTKYDKKHIDGEYARIDKGKSKPGYFTDIAASAINTIKANEQTTKWYSLDGKQTKTPRKGLNIMKTSNGKTKKVLVK